MNRLRGNRPTKVDAKGRLKVPAAFRDHLLENYGPEVYVTSLTGKSALIYPLSVWESLETRVYELARHRPSGIKFLSRTSFYGQEATMDNQGRIILPLPLRNHAQLDGEVAVLGKLDHLEVWNLEVLEKQLEEEAFTLEDFNNLADLGV